MKWVLSFILLPNYLHLFHKNEYLVSLYGYSIATQKNANPPPPPTHSNSVVYGTQIYNRNKYVCLFQQLLGKSHPEKSLFLRFQSYVSSLSSVQYVVSPKHFCIF